MIRSVLSVSFLLKIIFALALFMLLFMSGITYRHSISLSKSTELLVHSYKVQLELEQLISYVKDSEIGKRAFIITKDSVFLQPYIVGPEKVNKTFTVLKELTAGQPEQQAILDELSHLVDMRYVYMANSLIVMSVPFGNKLLDDNMIKGDEIMNSIQANITKLVDLEMSNFNKYQAKYYLKTSITPVITFSLLLFSVLIFVLAYLRINNDLNKLKRSNEKLLITTESIKHAEFIGEFFTSIWNIKTNQIIYSDNMFRLLGCEPHSFEPTVENYLKFVHQDDRHIVILGNENILNNHKTYPRYYRIIRKDGKERYFKAIGKFIEDDSGNSTHISVVSDVSEQHLSKLILKERNRELQQSNKELAYFNQGASHDLQEPLRKVQTLISLILEREVSALSDSGRDYFSRIQISVSRMRTLIDDLLLFSRTNTIDKTFEQTDLNVILKNTLSELSQSIEEKNANIQTDRLPELKVISFQIQQLFQNLISNSLKYSKPGVVPIIKFECEQIKSSDYPALNISRNKKYYKITVTDNGIGFEQQYAEKIFTIFTRLQTSAEYPGTGIGLSICKKIVENHSGYIFAEGKLGIGAVFNIFLPSS
jgi:hypothetical protein